MHQELLHRAVSNRHPIIRHFVETLAPQVLIAFSHISALGGSATTIERDPGLPLEAISHTLKDKQRFSETGYDQSLSAHLFNGIFAGARIAELLPETNQLQDIEWQVWILGFIVHDYTKAKSINIHSGEMGAIRKIIEDLGNKTLHFSTFLPDWYQYLADIVFIAQNTQMVVDANLNPSAYPDGKLHPRRLDLLRSLAGFADVLVHITRPSDVAERDARGRNRAQNLRTKLGFLFAGGPVPRLIYHQLTEVRGLISNLINNAVMRTFEAQGHQPYLFFPDGVVYIATSEQQMQLDVEVLINAVWGEVGSKLTGIEIAAEPVLDADDFESTGGGADEYLEAEREGGVRITRSKDYLAVPPVLYELLSFEQLLSGARATALGIKPTQAKTAARLGAEVAEDEGIPIRGNIAEKQKQYAEIGQRFAIFHGLPTDVRSDRIAEFCAFVHRRLRDLFPRPKDDVWLSPLLLNILNMEKEMPAKRVYRNNGGTPTGWFFTAAHYLKLHPEVDAEGVETLLIRVQEYVLRYLQEYQPKARPDKDTLAWAEAYKRFLSIQPGQKAIQGQFELAFRDYARNVLVVDGHMIAPVQATLDRFAQELQQYTERKENNKIQCTLCSSPYESRRQRKGEVLFKPQQYSNKMRLDSRTVVRGICPICDLEMMLRQVQQGMRAGSAQDQKAITLFLYPTYFFTAETAFVVHDFINQLQDINLSDLIFIHLSRTGFKLDSLARYDLFLATEGADPTLTSRNIDKPKFSDRDPASLFFFTLRPRIPKSAQGNNEPTDTDAWVIPTFYALALPLLLDLKVVASSSFVPVYSSGADFRCTTILDAPHSFTQYAIGKDQFRVNELNEALWRLMRLYELYLDVFSKEEGTRWSTLNAVVKDISTDPYAVFGYYERKLRSKEDNASPNKSGKAVKHKAKVKPERESNANRGIPLYTIDRYMAIYFALGGEKNMGFIGALVDAYSTFYQPENLKSSHAVLAPLSTAIEETVDSDPKTELDDLLLLVAGAVNGNQERIRNDPATKGFDPIAYKIAFGTYPERLALSRKKIEEFAALFIREAFVEYCNSDRAILRERANRIRAAARFYYLKQHARRDQPSEDEE